MDQWVQCLPASLKSWIPSPALHQLGVVAHRMVGSSGSSSATKSVLKEPELQREGMGGGQENRKREDREDEQK